MAENITVLLIEDNPEFAELVQQWLEPRQELSFTLNWTDTLEAGLRRLANGGIDVVLMDMGLPDSDGVETFVKLRSHTEGIPVIVLSASEDEAIAIHTVQDGAQDYLVKNACNAEALVRSLRYAILRYKNRKQLSALDPSAQSSKVIGLLGASGGVGTTTIACHIAVELRKQTGQKVLLADLDLHAGIINFVMKLDSRYSILDATRNLHRLDADFWKTLVFCTQDGVDVLGSPVLLGQPAPEPQAVADVLSLARSYYDWIVVDLGRLSEFALSLLEKTNEVLVVSAADVSALYQGRRIVQELNATVLNNNNNHVRLIVNQISPGTSLRSGDIEKIFGSPVDAALPADPSEALKAQAVGKLLKESSPLREGIAELARKLAGLETKKTRHWAWLMFLKLFQKGKRQTNLQTANI